MVFSSRFGVVAVLLLLSNCLQSIAAFDSGNVVVFRVQQGFGEPTSPLVSTMDDDMDEFDAMFDAMFQRFSSRLRGPSFLPDRRPSFATRINEIVSSLLGTFIDDMMSPRLRVTLPQLPPRIMGRPQMNPHLACMGDARTFCQDLLEQGNRLAIGKCLISHKSELSEMCAAAISNTIVGRCGDDIHRFCESVEPGQGRILRCLSEHKDEVSETCKVFLQEGCGCKHKPADNSDQAPVGRSDAIMPIGYPAPLPLPMAELEPSLGAPMEGSIDQAEDMPHRHHEHGHRHHHGKRHGHRGHHEHREEHRQGEENPQEPPVPPTFPLPSEIPATLPPPPAPAADERFAERPAPEHFGPPPRHDDQMKPEDRHHRGEPANVKRDDHRRQDGGHHRVLMFATIGAVCAALIVAVAFVVHRARRNRAARTPVLGTPMFNPASSVTTAAAPVQQGYVRLE